MNQPPIIPSATLELPRVCANSVSKLANQRLYTNVHATTRPCPTYRHPLSVSKLARRAALFLELGDCGRGDIRAWGDVGEVGPLAFKLGLEGGGEGSAFDVEGVFVVAFVA